MGVRQTKFQGPITDIKFGCCSALRLGQWVNAEVANQVYSSNGYIVNLSDAAVQKIKAAYTGKPLKVVIKRPCGCYCVGCGRGCKLNGCVCPTPVANDFAPISQLWFARESQESMCDGFNAVVANACCAGIPGLCSTLCVHTTDILAEDINLNSAVPLGSVVLDVFITPPHQNMAINQAAMFMEVTTKVAPGTGGAVQS